MNERARRDRHDKQLLWECGRIAARGGRAALDGFGPGHRPASQTLIREHPEVLEWTSTVMETFRDNPLFILYNTNGLVGKYDGLDGLKTGHTNAAGWCLAATAVRGNVRLISVVMGTDSKQPRGRSRRGPYSDRRLQPFHSRSSQAKAKSAPSNSPPLHRSGCASPSLNPSGCTRLGVRISPYRPNRRQEGSAWRRSPPEMRSASLSSPSATRDPAESRLRDRGRRPGQSLW